MRPPEVAGLVLFGGLLAELAVAVCEVTGFTTVGEVEALTGAALLLATGAGALLV